MGSLATAILKYIGDLVHDWRQRKRLKKMLSDKRFPKGFRSTGQLVNGIGSDRTTTERLLLSIGASKSEVSDEWRLK